MEENVNEIKPADILKEVIEKCGLTPYAFVKKLKYKSPGTIYHVLNGENGEKEIPVNMRQRIILAFPNVSYNYLKTGTGDVFLTGSELTNQLNLFNIKPLEEDEEEQQQGSKKDEEEQRKSYSIDSVPFLLEKLIEEQKETNRLLSKLVVSSQEI